MRGSPSLNRDDMSPLEVESRGRRKYGNNGIARIAIWIIGVINLLTNSP